MSRLYACNEGRIAFDGEQLLDVAQHRIAALGIGRTFQNLALFGSMSVLDNVMVGRHCRTTTGFVSNALRLPHVRAEAAATRQRALELVHFLNLDAVAAVAVSQLPFALRKR